MTGQQGRCSLLCCSAKKLSIMPRLRGNC